MTLEKELKILNSDKESDIRKYFNMENRKDITESLDKIVRRHMVEAHVESYETALSDVLANDPELKERYYTVNFSG